MPIALLAALAITGQADASLVRALQPSISPDGSQVAFSWQGDIWVVPIAGGRATRLTVNPASDTIPQWTPDGKTIVFASDRFGGFDVMALDLDGGEPRRVTFDSGTEIPFAVSPDGRHVYGYTTSFTGSRVNLFRVPIGGGDLVRLTDHPFEQAFYPSVSADARRVVYNRGAYGPGTWRKPGVRGPAMGEIWIADNTVPLTNHRAITKNDAMDQFPKFAADGSIFFVSNRDGWPNLYRMGADGRGARKLTDHSNGTLRFPSVSRDGDTAVYDFSSNLYVLDVRTGQRRLLEIQVPRDARRPAELQVTLNNSGLSDFSVSPDGKRGLLVLRGEIFLIPAGGGTTRRLTDSPALDQSPRWIDNRKAVYVATAEAGRREIWTVDIDGKRALFLKDARDLTNPLLSPDGKTLALHRGDDEIVLVPAAGGEAKTLIRGDFQDALRGAASFSWSPDSKFLAVGRRTDRLGEEILVVDVASGKSTVVARTPGSVSTPQFLPNGRGVFFSGVYVGEDPGLYVVDLVPQDVTFTEDDLDAIDKEKPKDPPVAVRIQAEGIEQRVRLLALNASGIAAAPDSRAIWANTGAPGTPPALVAVPVSGGTPTPVAGITGTASQIQAVSGRVFIRSLGRLFTVGQQGAVPVSFNAQFSVDQRAEEMALFTEIGWLLDRLYYDTGMHGKDWNAIRAKFAKVVPHVVDRNDFYSLMGEMMEELDSSHLGATPPGSAEDGPPSATAVGLIGVEWDPAALANGKFVVARVIPGSPAAHPQSLLRAGDELKTVDGVAPSRENPVPELLNQKANRRVRLGIERGGVAQEIAIRPTSSGALSELLYQDWVRWQRAETERLSGGRLTYMHIRAMSQGSLDQWLREIRTLTPGKDGVVIDVRFNGGGSTAQDILNVMIRRPWLIRTSRGAEGFRVSENIMRGQALELPTILLSNQFSASNAEVFHEGYRRLGLGKVVGEPTMAYVIGTGAASLWDGGSIRMPSLGAYAVDGENLENNPRRPDIEVGFDPDAWRQGRDVQLERAVQELLKTLPDRKG